MTPVTNTGKNELKITRRSLQDSASAVRPWNCQFDKVRRKGVEDGVDRRREQVPKKVRRGHAPIFLTSASDTGIN
ncbi:MULTISPECIES: hypothetical protein [Novosphingobium]|uniref:hypothetical protein n=1 Tax=Novosphingobium sp. TCA1 TaxID=2682474 RepID=UPI001054F247|nr:MULTISPECIES: hypothetical protein [Novosphingobium]